VGTNRRIAADTSWRSSYIETLAFVCPLPKMRIDLPRSHGVLVSAVDVALFVFLA